MAEEHSSKIADIVTAHLVECAPVAADVRAVSMVAREAPEGASPTTTAREATQVQTGCDPPPAGQGIPNDSFAPAFELPPLHARAVTVP